MGAGDPCDHRDRQWKRVTPCVYCECGTRLYNGTLPKSISEQNALIDAIAEWEPARNVPPQHA